MDSQKTGFFEEQPGQFSMTRLLVFMLISYAILMSSYIGYVALQAYGKPGSENLMAIVVAIGAFLSSVSTLAMTFKIIQKPMEQEPKPPEAPKQ